MVPVSILASVDETIQTADSLRCFAFAKTDAQATTGLYYNAYPKTANPIPLRSSIRMVWDLISDYPLQIETIETTDSLRWFAFCDNRHTEVVLQCLLKDSQVNSVNNPNSDGIGPGI